MYGVCDEGIAIPDVLPDAVPSVQCFEVQCSAAQCRTVQGRAVQCSVLQYSVIQYSAICCLIQCISLVFTAQTNLVRLGAVHK